MEEGASYRWPSCNCVVCKTQNTLRISQAAVDHPQPSSPQNPGADLEPTTQPPPASEQSVKNVTDMTPSTPPKLALCRMDTLATRSDLGTMASLLGLRTGVEVGTQQGWFARDLLSRWTGCTEFHVVDLWKHQDNYCDGANVADQVHDACFQRAMLNLRPWLCDGVLRVHCELSCEAAKKIPPVDFVYLDARHDYKGVMEDLHSYWPLVKSGGMMAGHDFLDADEHKMYNPSDDWTIQWDGTKRTDNKAVKSAVLEFFGQEENHQLVYVTRDGPWRSWFVFKHSC